MANIEVNKYEGDYYIKRSFERLNTEILTYQKGNHVLCSSRGRLWLPDLRNIEGITVGRDACVADFGEFRRVPNADEQGTFLFIPAEGKEIPEELQKPVKRWHSAVAVCNLSDATIKIKWEGNEWVFNDFKNDKSYTQLQTQINDNLISDNAGFLVLSLVFVKDPELDALKPYKEGAIPRFSNEHTIAPATGYAIHDHGPTGLVVYAGIISYKTSAEAIWASIVANQGNCYIQGVRSQSWRLSPIGKIKTVSLPIREINRTHIAMVSSCAAAGGWLPDDDFAYVLSFDRENAKADLQGKIALKFDEIFEFPIREKWMTAIWKAGVDKGWIEEISHGGDCTGAIVIKIKNDWKGLLTNMLKENEIKIGDTAK